MKATSYLEQCLKKPSFRKEFYKAQVQDVLNDLRYETKELKRRIRLARRQLAPLADDDDDEYLLNVARRTLDLRRPLKRSTK